LPQEQPGYGRPSLTVKQCRIGVGIQYTQCVNKSSDES